MDDFAEAVNALEEAVDRAAWRAKEIGDLSNKEVANELRRIADQWEAEGD